MQLHFITYDLKLNKYSKDLVNRVISAMYNSAARSMAQGKAPFGYRNSYDDRLKEKKIILDDE